MKAALLGLPHSGKTLILQALTGLEPSKKEETMGTIKVPDERIDYLSDVYKPKKKTYAEFVVSDFNLPADRESVISSKVKNLVQKADTLILVVRNFDSTLTAELKNPAAEYGKLRDDILLTDILVIEKRFEREAKERKNPPELPTLKKLKALLEEMRFPKEGELTAEELERVVNYNFLSLKKPTVLVNQPEGESEIPSDLRTLLDADGLSAFALSAALEHELAGIAPAEQAAYLKEFGLTEPASRRFVRHIYRGLGLVSFLTAGEDEVRAWPIREGTIAVHAAGKIHTDIEKGFIRAEVVSFDDFKAHGSEAECKKAGTYRLEGKEYVVRDGDIINFRFNV
ncbi:MAG: redox-regulated ATPase YchF [Spirochaetales bacterium]|nr:redox-regulated ATPase YchF [Spirochaetales bacterium]